MVSVNPHIYARMPFDPVRDIVPVASAARVLVYLLVRPDLPPRNIAEFIAYLKANPGKLSYGSPGNGSSPHLAGEMMKSQAGVFAVHVPYRGAAPALQDLLAGQIDYYFDPATGFGHLREGRARLLAVTGSKRSTFFPDVPTLTELGIKGVELGNWFGLFAPAATPPDVVARIGREVANAVALPEVRQRFAELGAEPMAQDAAAFRGTIANETKVLSALIRERKIVVD